MASRNLDDCIYQLKVFTNILIPRAKLELTLTVFVVCVMRLYQEQEALYAQGRMNIYEVNLLRQKASMQPLPSHLNNKVTWTLDSKHVVRLDDKRIDNDKSRAIDYGLLDKYGNYRGDMKADINEDNISDYKQLGELGMKIAVELDYPIIWGGDLNSRFKGKDPSHFEWMI